VHILKCTLSVALALAFCTLPFTPSFAGESDCVENVCRDVAVLKDTVWKLVELGGSQIIQAPEQRREARITLTATGSRLNAFGGCNQLAGGFVQEGNALRFAQMASTMMACESPSMELEDRFLKMLGTTTNYRIEGQQLILLGADQTLARFEAVHEKVLPQ
jgi:heat shock protein HslJ